MVAYAYSHPPPGEKEKQRVGAPPPPPKCCWSTREHYSVLGKSHFRSRSRPAMRNLCTRWAIGDKRGQDREEKI